jgi:hypothetical protein
MDPLTENEKRFLAHALVLEMMDARAEWAIAQLAMAAEVAAKLGITAELQSEAGFAATRRRLEREAGR